jgi:hypothetical protein
MCCAMRERRGVRTSTIATRTLLLVCRYWTHMRETAAIGEEEVKGESSGK